MLDYTGKAPRYPKGHKWKTEEQFQPGTVYTESDLRREAYTALRAENRKEHGKRGAGHVQLEGWSIRILDLKDGSTRVRLVAKGSRHNMAGERQLNASAVL